MLHNKIDVIYTDNYKGVRCLPLFDHAIVFKSKHGTEDASGSIVTRSYKATLGAFSTAGEIYNVFMKTYKKQISLVTGAFCHDLRESLGEHDYVLDEAALTLHTGILANDKCFVTVGNNFIEYLKKELPYDIYVRAERAIEMFLKRLNVLSSFVTLSVDAMYYDIREREYKKSC